jgi:hypothetical protein
MHKSIHITTQKEFQAWSVYELELSVHNQMNIDMMKDAGQMRGESEYCTKRAKFK